MNDEPYKELKDALHCPACQSEIESVQDLQNPQPLKKGNIIICGNCGVPYILGDSDLIKMTKDDIAKLDAQSRSMVIMGCASVMERLVRERAEQR